MPPDALAADTEALTIDQAIADLTEEPKREEAAPETPEAAPAEAETEIEAEPAAEDASEPETATAGEDAEQVEGEADGERPEPPALDPPRFWDAEAKARFGELPRDLQELVLAKETEASKAVSKRLEEAATKAKAAEAEVQKLGAFTSKLDKLIPDAEASFAAQYGTGEIDWNRVAQEHGVETAFRLKNDHDNQLAKIQQLKAAKDEADSLATSKFREARAEELKSVVPELADAKDGPTRQLDLVRYLASEGGVDPSVIVNRASAKELAIGYKAYLYDKLQADAKAKASNPKQPAKPTPATPQRPSVKPTAAVRPGSPETSRLKSLQARFNADPSMENLIALEQAKGM